jgi:hypothetical protein
MFKLQFPLYSKKQLVRVLGITRRLEPDLRKLFSKTLYIEVRWALPTLHLESIRKFCIR